VKHDVVVSTDDCDDAEITI